MAEQKYPIREAERYLQNARQILTEKAEKDGDYYNDSNMSAWQAIQHGTAYLSP
jgi:hypothetical protein